MTERRYHYYVAVIPKTKANPDNEPINKTLAARPYMWGTSVFDIPLFQKDDPDRVTIYWACTIVMNREMRRIIRKVGVLDDNVERMDRDPAGNRTRLERFCFQHDLRAKKRRQ